MNQIDQQAFEITPTPLSLNELIKQYVAVMDDASLSRLHFNLQDRVMADSDGYITK